MSITASRFLICTALLATAVLAGCSAGSTTGVLTGIDDACSGPLRPDSAHVWVVRGTTTVAHAQVPNGGTYRFVLAPGRYKVSNVNDLRGTPNALVVAGRTTNVNLPDQCV